MKKGRRILIGVLVVTAAFGVWRWKFKTKASPAFQSAPVERRDIKIDVLATGIVEPQNRVEIKPPIAGRVEDILVREGDVARKGQILAWMSSAERAALLDAARARGDAELARWEELYKPTPLIAPLTGAVIVRKVEPGQTVTSADAVLVMANRLIVRAQVDETDIGQVNVGQAAQLSLDAYPGKFVEGRVDHIAYEAETVSNVTIYEVEVAPARVPPFMRSGMTANITFLIQEKKDVLTVPSEAVTTRDGESFVMIRSAKDEQPRRQTVKVGITNGKETEIISGLAEGDHVLIKSFSVDGARSGGTNPFMPSRRRQSGSGGRP